MENVVHAVQTKGFVFHFSYRLAPEGETISHDIPCDSTAPETLVVSLNRTSGSSELYEVSLIVSGDDKRVWVVRQIVRLAFGFSREII